MVVCYYNNILNTKVVINIDFSEVFRLLNDEIQTLQGDINLYRQEMDSCIEFSRKYWDCRDKYHDAFVKRTYLIELTKRMKGLNNQ